jgi:hypothetical protein
MTHIAVVMTATVTPSVHAATLGPESESATGASNDIQNSEMSPPRPAATPIAAASSPVMMSTITTSGRPSFPRRTA